jgi:potassium-transporting ATPase KdpC subunit
MKTIMISLKMFIAFTVLSGILYPLFVTGMAQIIFPRKANGSLIIIDKNLKGSEIIGQTFDSSIYFASRPSSVSNNPLPSGGSNLGLSNKKLKDLVTERRNHFKKLNMMDSITIIPSEMLFASGSGLDPHISQKAAFLQVEKIVKARNFDTKKSDTLKKIILQITEKPQLGILGMERVNVLLLNMELDKIDEKIK